MGCHWNCAISQNQNVQEHNSLHLIGLIKQFGNTKKCSKRFNVGLIIYALDTSLTNDFVLIF